jgi:phage tail sheath protein FI
MPEYLSPGVYVEEINLGSKPIEGVSTSTVGFVGMAERGPVNRPVLVTTFGEYRRIFGGFLPDNPYGVLRRWLPYAVDGFFANGGKRAYVVRVANLAPAADPEAVPPGVAQTTLPNREFVSRPLLQPARTGDTQIDLSYWAGLERDNVLQLDDGDLAEFVSIQGFASKIQIAPSLLRDHSAGARVEQVSDPVAALARPPANWVGAPTIRVAAATTGLTGDTDYLISDGDQSEIVHVGTVSGGGEADVQVTPDLRFSHAPGTGLRKTTVASAASAKLSAEAQRGDSAIELDATTGLKPDDWVRIRVSGTDATDAEFVRLLAPFPPAPPFRVAVAPSLLHNHSKDNEVVATTVDPPAAPVLAAPTSIRLDKATGLKQDDVIMLEEGSRTEFFRLGGPPSASFDVLVTPTPRFAHAAGARIRQLVPATTPATLSGAASLGEPKLTLSSGAGLKAGDILEVVDGAHTEYVQLASDPTGPNDSQLTLVHGLSYPHPVSAPVRRLQGSLQVIAGPSEPDTLIHPEVGTWGNRIRIQAESASIARADVTAAAAQNGQSLSLSTTQGIEAGTVLRLPGNRHVTVSGADRNLVTLDSGLPAEISKAAVESTGDLAWQKQVMTCEFTLRFSDGVTDEVFPNLSMDPRHSRYFMRVINGNSRIVHVRAAATSSASAPRNQPLTHSAWFPGGGDDRLPPSGAAGSPADAQQDAAVYVGSDNDDADQRTGLFALLNRTDVSIVAVPGRTDDTVQRGLFLHAERARYRMAVLDPPNNASLDDVRRQRSLYDSKYAALYYPWIQVFDPLENRPIFAPPCGHICGIYADTDVTIGVHKAPANAIVAQALDLQKTITQGQQDVLNPLGINAIRAFPNRGIRVWGARTISSDPAWRYINVRRLFIFLEHSIDEATQYAVFEPNDVPLWERLRGSVTAFLTTQWRAGMLQGRTAQEAFFVKVGLGETMTQDDIDNGRVIMLIGVAPVKPAEFVIFRITQMPRGSAVTQ